QKKTRIDESNYDFSWTRPRCRWLFRLPPWRIDASAWASPSNYGLAVVQIIYVQRKYCRSWLASESGVTGEMEIDCTDAFAGKPAPTGFAGIKKPLKSGAVF
ncbi:hypothetical protein J1D76_23980, partial [Pseudomonas sp. NFX15]